MIMRMMIVVGCKTREIVDWIPRDGVLGKDGRVGCFGQRTSSRSIATAHTLLGVIRGIPFGVFLFHLAQHARGFDFKETLFRFNQARLTTAFRGRTVAPLDHSSVIQHVAMVTPFAHAL